MNTLQSLQHRFMDYLLTGDAESFFPDIAGRGNVPVEIRANIYHHAYRQRLREAIDTDHEILGLYLGDELFDLMVDGFIRHHPSSYVSLRDFTSPLPEFLKNQAPFCEHQIIAEIARFERLLLDVFDALDMPSLTVGDLQRIPPEQWPGMRLRLHPSTQLFETGWNSVETWHALKNGNTPEPATQQPGGWWLLWRGTDRLSQFRSLPDEECELLMSVLRGADVSALCELVSAERGEEQAPAVVLNYLVNWLENGMVIGLLTE